MATYPFLALVPLQLRKLKGPGGGAWQSEVLLLLLPVHEDWIVTCGVEEQGRSPRSGIGGTRIQARAPFSFGSITSIQAPCVTHAETSVFRSHSLPTLDTPNPLLSPSSKQYLNGLNEGHPCRIGSKR